MRLAEQMWSFKKQGKSWSEGKTAVSVACLAVMISLCFNLKFRSNNGDNFSALRAKIYFLFFQELSAWQGMDSIDRWFKNSDQSVAKLLTFPGFLTALQLSEAAGSQGRGGAVLEMTLPRCCPAAELDADRLGQVTYACQTHALIPGMGVGQCWSRVMSGGDQPELDARFSTAFGFEPEISN